ncbi:MAG: hypothetical protein R3F59_35270 [Myxococcota bacterium]
MIEQATLQDFRCFAGELSVPLRPLTVAIGPNDTGKSTFLDALERAAHSGRWTSSGAAETFHAQQHAQSRIQLVPKGARASFLRVNLPVIGPPMQADGVQDAANPSPLRVPAVLDAMLRRDRRRYDAVVDALRQAIPGLQDIQIAVPEPSRRRLDLVTEGGWTVRPTRARPASSC